MVKNLAANAGEVVRSLGWIPGKISWRRKQQPTLEFLPEKSHCQRSLVGYGLWGSKRIENDLATRQQQQNRELGLEGVAKGYRRYALSPHQPFHPW